MMTERGKCRTHSENLVVKLGKNLFRGVKLKIAICSFQEDTQFSSGEYKKVRGISFVPM